MMLNAVTSTGLHGDAASRPLVPKDIVFVHIPKTAGTSMRRELVDAVPDAFKIYDYGDEIVKEGRRFLNARQSGADMLEGIMALRRKFRPQQRLLVSGHFVASKYLSVFHPASFVTFLRDPVARIASAYRHSVRLNGFTGSFADFYELPKQANIQTKMLCGVDLRDIGFIGLTEAMPDMIKALSRHLDVELKNRKDNIDAAPDAASITDEVRARILALNADDLRLYNHVKDNLDHFTNYRGRNGAGMIVATGRVSHRRDGILQGWVVTSQPGRLAEIEVRIGDEIVHRCYADEYRGLLHDKGVAPNGVCGFTVRLPASLATGKTRVRIVHAGSGSDLIGSPVTV